MTELPRPVEKFTTAGLPAAVGPPVSFESRRARRLRIVRALPPVRAGGSRTARPPAPQQDEQLASSRTGRSLASSRSRARSSATHNGRADPREDVQPVIVYNSTSAIAVPVNRYSH